MVGGGGIGTTQACGRGEGRKGGPGQEIQEFSPEGVDGGGGVYCRYQWPRTR